MKSKLNAVQMFHESFGIGDIANHEGRFRKG